MKTDLHSRYGRPYKHANYLITAYLSLILLWHPPCDNSHPDYLKTHFVVSDINGVEQFDNVDLFFFDKQKALDYAINLSASIAPCAL